MNTALPQFVLRCFKAPILPFPLKKPITFLGRASACDFVINDPSVSRRHAEIRITDTGLQIVDLASRYGTFVANLQVQACPLSPGDLIRIGNIQLLLDFVIQSEIEETNDPNNNAKDSRKRATNSWHKTLTEAQRRVFKLLLSGLPEKTIATQLALSPHTIHNHARQIYRAFRVHSRAQLVVLFSKIVKRD
jgi:pSer/pThr/pTyr-binding forkhead associated (FHA) protein